MDGLTPLRRRTDSDQSPQSLFRRSIPRWGCIMRARCNLPFRNSSQSSSIAQIMQHHLDIRRCLFEIPQAHGSKIYRSSGSTYPTCNSPNSPRASACCLLMDSSARLNIARASSKNGFPSSVNTTPCEVRFRSSSRSSSSKSETCHGSMLVAPTEAMAAALVKFSVSPRQ